MANFAPFCPNRIPLVLEHRCGRHSAHAGGEGADGSRAPEATRGGRFCSESRVDYHSYDLWASAHYLFDHGYHWTFGICLCQSKPKLLGQMLASMAGCVEPLFRLNLDHLFSRLSDGILADGRYRDCFASFVFDRPCVLQKDINGAAVFHRYEYFKKRLSFDEGMTSFVQDNLHPKTLVV